MDAMELVVNMQDQRAIKARLRRHIDTKVQALLWLICAALIMGGVALLASMSSVGWLLIGLATLPYMIVMWRRGELRDLRPSAQPKTITAVLDQDVLSYLPKKPTVADVAQAIGRTNGGLFFAIRFGLTPSLVLDMATHDEANITKIWEDADSLRTQLGGDSITPGMLITAIVQQFPQYEAVLAHLHIDIEDLHEGIRWQLRLKEVVNQSQAPRRTGGLARDWSFGYIPLLSRFGQNISQSIGKGSVFAVETESHKQTIVHMIETFSSGGTQNVTLIGPTGVGKSMLVEAFAERLLDASSNLPGSLKFRQVIMLDAASLISAAPGRGEIEHLVMNILGEAYAAKNIIVCLDNAQLFFEDGVGSVDIGNVLLPIIEAGNLRLILTMDEQRFVEISRKNPNITNALNRITVSAADEADTMRVMEDKVLLLEYRRKVTYTYQALREAYRLSLRYVHDIAMPGQALKLLESAAGYAENGLVTINAVQRAIEQTLDIKVSVASESDDREKLLNLESLLHERMIGQARAVQVVSDALRRARAGVRNEDRPIGTFLFLGPTGVGKTELSKALANVYFGGENRMIRLDLNEYVRNEDVARLIADAATDPTSLTAQVMKQPYSVVLLDEIEKAHPNVLTTLLQLLDEGILRDINNREVSFRDAIVIATSNAGADRIREYIQRGYKLEQFEEQITNDLVSSGQFRPEFLNRFDEIVVFGSLSKAELLQVVDIILKGVNKTLAPQKITVRVTDEAKKLLVERGYDPRLGARPMRRVVQKAVENTVAKAVLGGSATAGDTVDISYEQVAEILGSGEAAQLIADNASVPGPLPDATIKTE